jgi:hypothetical protein
VCSICVICVQMERELAEREEAGELAKEEVQSTLQPGALAAGPAPSNHALRCMAAHRAHCYPRNPFPLGQSHNTAHACKHTYAYMWTSRRTTCPAMTSSSKCSARPIKPKTVERHLHAPILLYYHNTPRHYPAMLTTPLVTACISHADCHLSTGHR